MKTAIVMIAVLLFAGCSTRTVVETVQVDVPVPVSCINPVDVPQEVPLASDGLRLEDDPGTKIKAVLIERERLRQADTEFRALIRGCLL